VSSDDPATPGEDTTEMSDHYALPDRYEAQANKIEARRTEVLKLREEIEEIDSLLARREQELGEEIAALYDDHLPDDATLPSEKK
jgi:hypothetical protein